MERFTISKSEKQTIYEIYRACRLCGAGGGYRMPIIQNIIDLDSSEVELRQKIQECLQLEVRPDDRMPPLICEICVDKLNDFYEFLELARQTNVKTRTRLGLPIQTAKKGEPESNDCILGVTEPVYVKEDDAAKKSKAGPKSAKKIKKEPEAKPEVVQVKVEKSSSSSRSSSVSSRAERPTRHAPEPRPRRSLPATAPATAPTPAPATRRKQPEKESRKPEKAPETHKNVEVAGRCPSVSSRSERPTRTAPEPRSRRSLPAASPATAPASHRKQPEDSRSKQDKALETPNLEVPKDKKGHSSMRKELATLLEESMKFDDNSLLMPRTLKRTREEPPRPAVLPKRAKPPPKEPVKEPVKEPSPPRTRPGPKSRRPVRTEPPEPDNIPVPLKVLRTKPKPETPAKAKEPPKPPQEPSPPAGPPFKCVVCDALIKSAGAFTNHMRSHVPCFTKLTNACNPCGKWFLTPEEAAIHHRYHRAPTFPYHCRRCFDDFRTLQLYDDHISKGLCVQDEPPQVKCDECWAVFAGEPGRAAHKCPGRSGRPGGKCSKCSRTYATAKTLKRHESQCGQRKAGDLVADPDVLRRLKPMRVRITRCDSLLAREKGDHYDVSRVKPTYGLARNYIYPYMKLPPKTEPPNRKSSVAVPVALKEEPATDYTHWDSDDSDSDIIRKVPSLSTLAIKKLFSKNLLGKVPRKRRKAKNEEFEDFNDVSSDINNIISSLGDLGNSNVDRNALTARIKDIIGCLDGSEAGDVNIDENDKAPNKDIRQGEDDKQDDVRNVCVDDTRNNSDKSTKENLIESKIDNDNCKESSNVEMSVSNKSNNVEASVCEESNNGEMSFGEESNVEDSIRGEPGNVEGSISEESNNTEANVSEAPSNVEANVSNTDLDNHSNNLDDENEKVNRIDMEIENLDSYKNDNELDVSLQKSIENDSAAERELENVPVNGISHENEKSMEVDNDSDINEPKKNEEIKPTKESPIKHSIENLIGETDRNPDKYIKEVISSIEDIIMKNPRTDEMNNPEQNGQENEISDRNLMEALDEQIGEKRVSDHDKITLEDLLPKENKHEELENISDDDFNFDA